MDRWSLRVAAYAGLMTDTYPPFRQQNVLAMRERLGEDDPHTLSAAASLGDVAWDEGRYADAREVDEDVLARRRRIVGDDHRDTLTAASSLASDLRKLGRFHEARELQEDTLARRRQFLGDDHIDTFHSARDLAATLRELGDVRAAHELDEDTYARSTRALSPTTPARSDPALLWPVTFAN
jgi:hypothetical protein